MHQTEVKRGAATPRSARRGTKLAKKTDLATVRLGNKGKETRAALMQAARHLLDIVSPLSLTAASISKEAGTGPATFYVYFENVEDILWALCADITDDTEDLFADDSILRIDARLEEDALAFVRAYAAIWTRHGPLLLYRNMESDRGNRRFSHLVTRIGVPIMSGMTDRIVAASPPERGITRSEANAEAVVLVAAIDRIAAAIHLYPEESVTPDKLLRAEARVLTRMLRNR